MSQVEAVCGPPAGIGRDVLEGLGSLVDNSLLGSVRGSDPDPRFTMLPTIREYAIERLDASHEANEIHRRHAMAYLGLIEGGAAEISGQSGPQLLRRLDRDHDNLRVALEWAIAHEEAAVALRMIAAMWRFWQIRGHLFEAQERIARALEMAGVAYELPIIRAQALGAAGSIAYWPGEPESVRRNYDAALIEARRSGDRATLAEALYNVAFSLNRQPADEASLVVGVDYVKESLGTLPGVGDPRGVANANWALGLVALAARDLTDARRYLDDSLQAYETLGDRIGAGWARHELGIVEIFEGAIEAAGEHFGEALEAMWATGNISGIVLILQDFMLLAEKRGQFERHWRLAGAADALGLRLGAGLTAAGATELGIVRPPTRPSG